MLTGFDDSTVPVVFVSSAVWLLVFGVCFVYMLITPFFSRINKMPASMKTLAVSHKQTDRILWVVELFLYIFIAILQINSSILYASSQ